MIPAARTLLVLLGHPVAHSLSPVFQQAALNAANLAVRYEARDTPPAALAVTLQELATLRIAGNVTIPHKESVFAQCVHLTDVARRVGAVNTFWFSPTGELTGHNTDVAGVTEAIRAVLPAAPSLSHSDPSARPPLRVALLGAGGSALSVVVALEQWNVQELVIFSRTTSRADSLAKRCPYPALVVHSAERAVQHADLVVNTTPIGLQEDRMPVSPQALTAHACALDLVYRRGETPWVNACRERGHRAEDGLRMLVEQGAAAFACWFARDPDRDAMWAALEPRPYRHAHASANPPQVPQVPQVPQPANPPHVPQPVHQPDPSRPNPTRANGT